MSLFSKECYIHAHYHLYCPGCGGTRAVMALLHGNLFQAIKYNALVVFFLMDILIGCLLRICLNNNDNRYKYFRRQRIYSTIIFVGCVLWMAFRDYLLLVHGIDFIGDFIP
ncbi:DUF2752 domain-containing protein [Clostridiaceae bacterium Marseille-Q4143]|nr:DUF2752 domain-containing protein [Clostridiaceae bacterium Marseille-Q4143]